MKPIAIAAVIAASLVAGFAGATVAVGIAQRSRAEAAETASAAGLARRETAHEASNALAETLRTSGNDTDAQITTLRDSIAAMQRDIEDLRAALDRREPTETGRAAVAGASTTDEVAALAGVNREAVEKILEDVEKKKQEQREAERKQREQEMFGRMAEKAAKDLGLSPADQQRLTDFMTVASTKRDEIFRSAREAGPDGFRTAFDDFRTWRDTELKGTFGDSLGQQLIDYTRDQGRGGFDGGFGGFGGFDRGGQGGGQSGGNSNGQTRQTGGGRGR